MTPALQGQAPGPKLNCAPQQLPGGLTQYYEPRPKSSSREFKTAMPHIHLEYNERQMLAFLICCWSPGSTFAIFKAAKPFPSWSATAQPHPLPPPLPDPARRRDRPPPPRASVLAKLCTRQGGQRGQDYKSQNARRPPHRRSGDHPASRPGACGASRVPAPERGWGAGGRADLAGAEGGRGRQHAGAAARVRRMRQRAPRRAEE